MTPTEQKHWDSCSAPFCNAAPEEELRDRIWYPNDPICAALPARGWIRTQRKIVKVGSDPDLYFDFPTLKRLKNVRKGIRGRNPDLPLKTAQKCLD